MIFDSHAHYDSEQFNEDRQQVIEGLAEYGVAKVINAASDKDSLEKTLKLTEEYDFFYGALGIHPTETEGITMQDMDFIRKQAALPKVVAIGEIGLDYYWDNVAKEEQKKWFDIQLELCRETGLPVIIHSREACKDTLDMLKPRKDITGVIHCYSYTKETARDYLNMGYYFGIGGVVTYKNAAKLKVAVEYIPMDRILLETDCPYLAPVPMRGKRNSSALIPYIIEEIARIKNLDRETVEAATWDNTINLFLRNK